MADMGQAHIIQAHEYGPGIKYIPSDEQIHTKQAYLPREKRVGHEQDEDFKTIRRRSKRSLGAAPPWTIVGS